MRNMEVYMPRMTQEDQAKCQIKRLGQSLRDHIQHPSQEFHGARKLITKSVIK
jgi:hypothetical protein